MLKTVKIREVLSIFILCQLITITKMFHNAVTFNALYLTVLFGLFWLAILVPNSVEVLLSWLLTFTFSKWTVVVACIG